MWSAPLVAVFAVVGALALFMALAPNDAAAQDTEAMDYQAGSPLELTVVPGSGAAKRTSLVLNWMAPTGGSDMAITGYRVDESTNGQRWTHLANVGANTLTHTKDGLKPGTERYFRVFAMNRAGTGRVSEAISNTTAGIGEPSEVQNLTVTATGPSSIKLDWDPPADDGGTRIIGYLIHWGDSDTIGTTRDATTLNIPPRGTADADGNGDGIVPVLAPTTEWTHKGLDGNTARFYRVYAVNWHDDSMTSKMTKDPIDIRTATTTPPGKPAAPTGLTAVPTVARAATTPFAIEADDAGTPAYEPAPNVNLYWYYPSDEGGADITRFRIEVSKTGAWPDGSVETAGTADTANTALASADFAVMTATRDEAFGETNSYQFQHTGAGQFLNSPGKLYYRVFAENGEVADGVSRRSLPDTGAAQSMVTKAMTQAAKPAPVAPLNPTWTGETAAKGMAHHYDSVNLSWTKGNGGNTPTAYRVDVAEGTAAPLKWKALEPDTRHSDPTYDHLGWRPKDAAQTFQYRVFAKDGGLIGVATAPDANVVDPQTAPSPVRSLVATTVSAKQNDITWQMPANDGGTDIVKYCVLATTSSTQALASTECTAAAVTDPSIMRQFVEAPKVGVLTERDPEAMYMHKSLMAATTYRYRVYAMNDAVDSTASPPLVAVDATNPNAYDASPSSEEDPVKTMSTTKPGAPTNLSAESAADSNFTATGARGVLVIWNGPADPAGDNVSGYEIQRKVNDGEFLLVQETSSRTTHYTDRSQPADDEVRMYRVRARNTLGWGPWTTMSVDYPLGEPTAPPPALGAAASDLAATANDDGSVSLSWTADSAATHYFVAGINSDMDRSSLVWEFADELGSHMVDADDLNSGETYTFLVIAGSWESDDGGTTWEGNWGSSWSNTDTADVP